VFAIVTPGGGGFGVGEMARSVLINTDNENIRSISCDR
jgi:hypothetical protein